MAHQGLSDCAWIRVSSPTRAAAGCPRAGPPSPPPSICAAQCTFERGTHSNQNDLMIGTGAVNHYTTRAFSQPQPCASVHASQHKGAKREQSAQRATWAQLLQVTLRTWPTSMPLQLSHLLKAVSRGDSDKANSRISLGFGRGGAPNGE